ncbi:IS200/IS605 family transposase [Microseira wollei]|uniref:Transposase IS200-family protein n=1 Tax=Microseira wollei NIES-4236 TaxID=2530354 RepID=A0AAV3WN34_9CYAN|nr:IS200/IS605 family transposase [Microseira wollei]GET43089.1 transposase IS200-family protein [Microseira wollei NIES-4236]
MSKFSPEEYRHEGNAVSLLNYHFVFMPTKRRKKVLVGDVAHRWQEVICQVGNENRWKIIAMEIMPDHVHLFWNAKPTDNPALMMNRIKARASHHLRKEFPELLKLPTLWTPSDFVSTAGNICPESVQRYIAQQRE